MVRTRLPVAPFFLSRPVLTCTALSYLTRLWRGGIILKMGSLFHKAAHRSAMTYRWPQRLCIGGQARGN